MTLRKRRNTTTCKSDKTIRDYNNTAHNINLKIIIMPSYGVKQKPAGKKLSCGCKPLGTRIMKSNNSTITPTLKKIDNITYKGNPVMLANK
jgi:hypothetical protein